LIYINARCHEIKTSASDAVDGSSTGAVPELKKMKEEYGTQGFVEVEGGRTSLLWFDLTLTDFYEKWKGKLIIEWPRPAIRPL
jgi:hypothetical protein